MLSEMLAMDSLAKLLGISSETLWTYVWAGAFALVLLRIFLNAASPRRAR